MPVSTLPSPPVAAAEGRSAPRIARTQALSRRCVCKRRERGWPAHVPFRAEPKRTGDSRRPKPRWLLVARGALLCAPERGHPPRRPQPTELGPRARNPRHVEQRRACRSGRAPPPPRGHSGHAKHIASCVAGRRAVHRGAWGVGCARGAMAPRPPLCRCCCLAAGLATSHWHVVAAGRLGARGCRGLPACNVARAERRASRVARAKDPRTRLPLSLTPDGHLARWPAHGPSRSLGNAPPPTWGGAATAECDAIPLCSCSFLRPWYILYTPHMGATCHAARRRPRDRFVRGAGSAHPRTWWWFIPGVDARPGAWRRVWAVPRGAPGLRASVLACPSIGCRGTRRVALLAPGCSALRCTTVCRQPAGRRRVGMCAGAGATCVGA